MCGIWEVMAGWSVALLWTLTRYILLYYISGKGWDLGVLCINEII